MSYIQGHTLAIDCLPGADLEKICSGAQAATVLDIVLVSANGQIGMIGTETSAQLY